MLEEIFEKYYTWTGQRTNIKNDYECGIPRHVKEKILDQFPEPKDNVERSFFQYKCQILNEKKSITFLKDAIASVVFLVMYTLVDEPRIRKHNCKNEYRAAFVRRYCNLSILPEVLKSRYNKIDEYPFFGLRKLSLDDKRFFTHKVLQRYKKHMYFCLKLLMRMEMYSYVLSIYDYKAIISHSEFSFSCSFLTDYCEHRHVEHINVMHGEKQYFIRESFVSFSKFYIWDKWYESLITSLRAPKEQFVCAIPEAMIFPFVSLNKSVDFTYYLQQESKEKLREIKILLRKIQQGGYVVAIRPHPRCSDFKYVKKLFDGFEIEDAMVSISASIQRTRNAIAVSSTVLYTTLINGGSIIIDDITYPAIYKKLYENDYIVLNKPHRLLSEIVSSL